MIIAFDLDGVLIHEDAESWIEYFEKVTGKTFDRQCFAKTHNWNEATGFSTQEVSDLFVSRHLSLTAADVRPIAGAVGGVKTLRQLGECHVVTARDRRIEAHTTTFVDAHFGSFNSYTFGHVESKVEAVKALGAAVLIEDSAYQAQLVAESGRHVIFFPQLRNLEHIRHHRHPQIIYPAAAKELSEDMLMTDLDDLHKRVWQEIIATCHELA